MPNDTAVTQTATEPAVRLNLSGWFKARKAHGFTEDAAIARAMTVAPNAIWRAQNGADVGGKFIGAAALALPDAHFNDMFEPYLRPVSR